MKNPWKQYSKVNPQREEGNRQINNTVFHGLMKAELSGSEFRVVMAIIDKTWGFQKESDCIAISQIMEATGLRERTVQETIKILKEKRLIHYCPGIRVHHGSPMNEFIFNKHYDTWRSHGCRKVHGCAVPVPMGAENGKTRVRRSAPTKETIQKKIQKKGFIIPTLDEVSVYCQERTNGVDPQRWHDFYSSKGWMIGKNKMKDWKAAIRTWEEREQIPKKEGAWC